MKLVASFIKRKSDTAKGQKYRTSLVTNNMNTVEFNKDVDGSQSLFSNPGNDVTPCRKLSRRWARRHHSRRIRAGSRPSSFFKYSKDMYDYRLNRSRGREFDWLVWDMLLTRKVRDYKNYSESSIDRHDWSSHRRIKELLTIQPVNFCLQDLLNYRTYCVAIADEQSLYDEEISRGIAKIARTVQVIMRSQNIRFVPTYFDNQLSQSLLVGAWYEWSTWRLLLMVVRPLKEAFCHRLS